MPSIEDLIIDALNNSLANQFSESQQNAVLKKLAVASIRHLDAKNCTILPSWDQFDDPFLRDEFINSEGGVEELCAENLCSDEIQKTVNSIIQKNGYGKISKPKLKAKLQIVLPDLLRLPPFSTSLIRNPFPKAWNFIANELAIQLFDTEDRNLILPGWQILNHLLLIGYFQDSRLPMARNIRFNLMILRKPILDLRCSLIRIPERISGISISDKELNIAKLQTLSSVRLMNTNWSELQGHLQFEINQMSQNSGILHQILDVNKPSILAQEFGLPQAQLAQLRDLDYTQVEYAIISYLSLSAIEQLLRGWASNAGILHSIDSTPIPWSDWIDELPLSNDTIIAIKKLYQTDELNLRNRVMHGGLLPLTSKQSELVQALANQMGYQVPPVDLTVDRLSTRNIALTCLECLIQIDQDSVAQNINLDTADRAWELSFALTDSEISIGNSSLCNIGKINPIYEYRQFMRYVYGVFPAFADCYSIGLYGANQSILNKRSMVHHMCWGLIFEGIYRSTAHLLGVPIIRKNWEHIAGRKVLHYEYRMLDSSKPDALCGESNLNRLLDHLSDAERMNAKMILLLAVKARNALAHGAVVKYSEHRLKGEQRILIKAVEILKEAGIHHMVKEAAYYRWLTSPPSSTHSHEKNWVEAEKEIYLLVEKTLPPLPAT